MTPEITTTIVAVVAVIIAIYALYKARQPLTVENVTTTLTEATSTATELTEVALTAAQAAEQLYRTGKIAPSARLDTAFDYVRRFFPETDQEQIVMALEAAVLVVNTMVDALPDKRDGMPPVTKAR